MAQVNEERVTDNSPRSNNNTVYSLAAAKISGTTSSLPMAII